MYNQDNVLLMNPGSPLSTSLSLSFHQAVPLSILASRSDRQANVWHHRLAMRPLFPRFQILQEQSVKIWKEPTPIFKDKGQRPEYSVKCLDQATGLKLRTSLKLVCR
jgi:hypothetical protein